MNIILINQKHISCAKNTMLRLRILTMLKTEFCKVNFDEVLDIVNY